MDPGETERYSFPFPWAEGPSKAEPSMAGEGVAAEKQQVPRGGPERKGPERRSMGSWVHLVPRAPGFQI